MLNNKKTAVVYDKWLSTLGGGEVVACTIAKILKDSGYDVTFISGKPVSFKKIKNALGIDLSGIKFKSVWNDELELKQLVEGKDLFINCSFMDYSYGYAKKNIYYTHFPTESYTNLKGMIFNRTILPLASKLIKPIEFLSESPSLININNQLAYSLDKPVKIAFSFLNPKKVHLLKFSLFLENFYFSLLKNLNYKVINSKIVEKQIIIDHYHNLVHFYIKIKPETTTVYLEITPPKIKKIHLLNKDRFYLLYPKIIDLKLPEFIYKLLYEKINTRLRAGVFINILNRLKSYQLILADSEFTKKWVKNYWKREAKVLYPPVDFLFEKYDLSKIKKENWLCNVGRFFTLGHGKKQEVLVEAFKKLYNQGYKNWQLHLIGGVGNEPGTLEFVKYLKKQAKGYPIYFHFDIPRKKVEEILVKSKIYWHATGFGEKKPIKMEHFGIAPIEAMSAGCVPVLYNGGGLTEIIEKLNLNPAIHLFSGKSQLIENTKKIIKENIKIKEEIFIKLTNLFSKNKFNKNLLKLLNEKI